MTPACLHEVPVRLGDGATVVLRRLGNPNGPRLALSHGNGLAIAAYEPFWSLLADDFDLVLFDMRNHGVNPTHEFAAHNWQRFTDDMGDLLDACHQHFGRQPTVGVFHSLSAVASVAYEAQQGPAYAGLALFDPPLMPPPGHPARAAAEQDVDMMAARARRRQPSFNSPDELAEQFLTRAFFSRWVEGAAELFAKHTLRNDADSGTYTLSCPREYEAHVFEFNRDASLWAALKRGLQVPVAIIAADPDLPDQTAPALSCAALSREADIAYTVVPDTTHFLQVEQPDACVAAVKSFVASL